MTSLPNTLLIDGNDIRADFTGIRVYGDMNLYAPGTRRGDDDVIPGRRGAIPAPGLQLAAYAFSVTVTVTGATRGAMIANLVAASSILGGVGRDGLVTLQRRLAASDDASYIDYTAQGRFNGGLAMSTLNPVTGRCEWQFTNLDGAWRRTDNHVLTVP